MRKRFTCSITNVYAFAALVTVYAVGFVAVVAGGLLTDKLAFALGVVATVMAANVKFNGKGLFS